MTARPQDVALLPLPKRFSFMEWDTQMRDYARANVTAALASAQAREEELRAEVERLEIVGRLHEGTAGLAINAVAAAEARNERLEEALRELFDDYKRLADSGDAGFWKLEDTYAGKKALAALSTNAATQTGERR